jgi:subtilisin family serine protease
VIGVRKQLYLPDEGPTGRGIRVAILDSGVDSNHPDLAGRIDESNSAGLTLRGDLNDRDGHGTHVASIIGGSGEASNGLLRGIAPDAELVIYKVTERRRALEGNSIRAIELAIDAGVHIINFSSGYVPDVGGDPPWLWPADLSLLEEAFAIASASGILCVVAAGNSGPNEGSIARPGGLGCVLTVGAVDGADTVLDTSSRGPFRRSSHLRRGGVTRYDAATDEVTATISKPDIVAPGIINAALAEGCFHADDSAAESADPHYVVFRGSSQATAVVSGVAALVLELIEEKRIDLGLDRAATIRRLFSFAASTLTGHTSHQVGAGIILWPKLVATLEDFSLDPQFRNIVLSGSAPQLLG